MMMNWETVAARLQEKSTYAGLTVVISMLLPLVAKYVPVLASTDAAAIVGWVSMIGTGIGGLMAILFRENGSKT